LVRCRYAWLLFVTLLGACGGTVTIVPTPSSGPSATGSTGTATLSWVAPATTTTGLPLKDLAGYHIYYGSSPTAFDHQLHINDPALTTAVIEQLAAGTWYFAATAVDSTGLESAYSNIASKTIS
jgi:hypothetical protein